MHISTFFLIAQVLKANLKNKETNPQIKYRRHDLSVLNVSYSPVPHLQGAPGGPLTHPLWGQQRRSTCVQCACPVWKKLAVQWLRCVRLKGKGNEETDHNNK